VAGCGLSAGAWREEVLGGADGVGLEGREALAAVQQGGHAERCPLQAEMPRAGHSTGPWRYQTECKNYLRLILRAFTVVLAGL